MDTAYEMFVRSANEAHCFATAQDRKAVKTFNKRVRRLWSRIEPEKQAAWIKLFDVHPEDVPLVVEGKELLLSQELHAALFPDDCRPRPKRVD